MEAHSIKTHTSPSEVPQRDKVMEVITGFLAVTGLISGITKIATSVSNIKQQWQYASLNISMVSGSLWAVKAALEEIAEWRGLSNEKSQKSEQLDKNLKVCVESCAVLIAVVENRLKDIDLDNISKLDKARFLGLDALFKDFANSLGAQVRALQLLLTIYQCRSLAEQNELLQKNHTQKIVWAAKQSTVSMAYEERDIEDAASILSETPSTSFSFDQILMQYQSYSRTYPILYQRMQQKFPYRKGTVVSTVKSSFAQNKESEPLVDDPIIAPMISLPFLGIPYAGEKRGVLDEMRIDNNKAMQDPTLESGNDLTLTSKGLKFSLKDPKFTAILDPVEWASIDIPRSPDILKDTSTVHLCIAVSEKDKYHDADQSTPDQIIERQSKAKRKRLIRRPFFNSLYDDSDDDCSHNTVLEERRTELSGSVGICDLQPEALSSPQTSPSPKMFTHSVGSMQDGSDMHNYANLEVAQSDGKVYDSISPKGNDTFILADVETNQNDKQEVRTILREYDGAFEEEESHTFAKADTVSGALPGSRTYSLDFNFGPDLDLKMDRDSLRDNESRSINNLTPSSSSTKKKDTLDPIAISELNAEPVELSTLARRASSTTIIPIRHDMDDTETKVAANGKVNPLAEDLSQDQHPRTAMNQTDAPPLDHGSLFMPPASEISKCSQEKYLVDQDSTKNTAVYSTTRTTPLPNVDVITAPRISFESRSSGSVQPSVSLTNVMSDQDPSSIPSTEAGYTSSNTTPTTPTIRTDPTLFIPRIIIDPVQHEQRRSAITNSLVKSGKGTIPAPSKLSAFSAKLLGATAGNKSKAKDLARAIEAGDVSKVSRLLRSYEMLADTSIAVAIAGDFNPKTALMRAFISDNLEIVQLLLGHDPSSAACTDR